MTWILILILILDIELDVVIVIYDFMILFYIMHHFQTQKHKN